jgi:hypothetical protein
VPQVWEFVFLMLILKLPIVYLCCVVYWAIKAEPRPPEFAALPARIEPEPRPPWSPPARRRPRTRGPHGSPSRAHTRSARMTKAIR